VTDKKTLRDFIELAAERRKVESGRKLAEIAQQAGHDISHSTINRIRKGDYPSAPTAAVLKAIAFLAQEPDELVFAAAPDTSDWAELEGLVADYLVTHERVRIIVDRYARLRGLIPEVAEAELRNLAPQRNWFFHRHADWSPPWAAQQAAAQKQPDSDLVDEAMLGHYVEMYLRAINQQRLNVLIEQARGVLGDDANSEEAIAAELPDDLYVRYLAERLSVPAQTGAPKFHAATGLTIAQWERAANRYRRELSEMIAFDGHIRTNGAPAEVIAGAIRRATPADYRRSLSEQGDADGEESQDDTVGVD
jgi:hypothetical protein